MPKPRTYTRRTSIGMLGELRDAFEEALEDQAEGLALSARLRDAALRVIGRADLVLEGRDETGPRMRGETPKWVRVSVSMTDAQHEALKKAAKRADTTIGVLLQDALRYELGMAPAPGTPEGSRGWKRGRRRSRSNPPKP